MGLNKRGSRKTNGTGTKDRLEPSKTKMDGQSKRRYECTVLEMDIEEDVGVFKDRWREVVIVVKGSNGL